MLVKYIRNRKGQPFGCVVALDPSHIGWSLCHVTGHVEPVQVGDFEEEVVDMFVPGDMFSKVRSVTIAEGRARQGWRPAKDQDIQEFRDENGLGYPDERSWNIKTAPQSVRKDLMKIQERANDLMARGITSWIEK